MNQESQTIRPAQFAGKFYPSSKQQLNSLLTQYFDQVQEDLPSRLPDKQLKILIAPHAGYPYSGRVAVAGFSQIDSKQRKKPQQRKKQTKNVILLGSSHQTFLEKAALFQGKSWETPLGLVEIDQDIVAALGEKAGFKINNQAHQNEHSLEVQLPFLQYQLSEDVKIIPILVGQLKEKALANIMQALKEVWSKNTLLVISSDLSHYPNYKLANQVDRETIQGILSGEVKYFRQIIADTKPTKAVQTRACGAQAIEIGMKLAKNWPDTDIELLTYANSGDASGNRRRVVGYAAIGFYSSQTLDSN